MTLPLHENRWVNVGGGLVLLALAAMVTLYIAGYFFLWSINSDPLKASPLTVLRYWAHYSHRPDIASAIKLWMGVSTVLVAIPFIALLVPAARSMHGNARFASVKEIKAAGLLGAKGIIIGALVAGLGRRYLMLPGQLGVLLAAPPRSGKGAGFVQTNMLNWNDSAVVLDIRQESWRVTSGFRAKHGQQCFLFNPLAEDGKTCQWNPLSYVSPDPVLMVNDLQKIANMLFPDPTTGDAFWMSSSRMVFIGVALYVFETPGLPRTIGEILRQVMFGEGESAGEHWKKIIEERDKIGKPLSSTCQRSLYDFIYTSGNTQSSIRKTFTSRLELWQNPIVDAATSGNSFDLRDFRKRRISLYIGVLPSDLERIQLILNLLFQQILEANTREMPEDNPELKYQLLMMMDEFTAIGKVPILAKSVSYLGGYNIRLCIVIQSPSQLRAEYGPDVAETIMTCMGAQIVYAPREQKHAKEISESLGVLGQKAASRTKPAGMTMSMGSTNVSEQRRELLLPQEVKEIGKLKEIVFLEDTRPILCSKIQYFKDINFKRRLVPPVNQPALVIAPPEPMRKSAPAAAGVQQPAAGGVTLVATETKSEAAPWREMAEITVADIERVDKLDLKDFDGDFDSIEIPGEPITDTEMKDLVDMFLATMD